MMQLMRRGGKFVSKFSSSKTHLECFGDRNGDGLETLDASFDVAMEETP
jgi:hypothetical protein